MRQWLVPTECLCDKHLLGEHVEHHMFVGTINKKKSLKGYLNFGLLKPETLQSRHTALVEEMIKRGMKHNSPLPNFSCKEKGSINIEENLEELKKRCPRCLNLILSYEKDKNIK